MFPPANSVISFSDYRMNEPLKTYIPMVSSRSSLNNEEGHFILDMDAVHMKNQSYRTTHDKTKKRFTLDDEGGAVDENDWSDKPIEKWSQEDTINWLMSAASYMGQPYRSIQHSLAIPGRKLLLLTRRNFIAHDSDYGGELYDLLHSQRVAKFFTHSESSNSASEDEDKLFSSSNMSDANSENIDVSSNARRRPTRGCVQKQKDSQPCQAKLWQFITDLLKNRDTCPSLICWEDYSQAKFRFVRTAEVAKRWGSRNGNTKMTYDKLSRAIRYHYRNKTFLPVFDRLVYQFGPNSKGWQTDNPNFRM